MPKRSLIGTGDKRQPDPPIKGDAEVDQGFEQSVAVSQLVFHFDGAAVVTSIQRLG